MSIISLRIMYERRLIDVQANGAEDDEEWLEAEDIRYAQRKA